MLVGEIMEAMTWASTLTYKGNKKLLDGLSCKSFVEKKKDPWEQVMEGLCKSTRGDN